MNRDDVEMIRKETVFQGYFRVDKYTVTTPKFDGGRSNAFDREVFERGQVAACLPYDPRTDEVVLIEQFRMGAYANGDANPWLIEIVAGVIDEGETPEDVVRRECVEESGCSAGRLLPLGCLYATQGACTETISLYVAEIDSTTAQGIHGLDEEDEDIRVFTVPFDQAMAMLEDGRIRNMAAASALLWLDRKRKALRENWTAA